MRHFMICTHQIFGSSKIKKNGMDRACSMYGEEERCIQDLGGET
jgi:hypothetical protein